MEEKLWKGLSVEPLRKFEKSFEGYGSFELKAPNGFEKTRIITETARALDGYGKSSVAEADHEYVRMLVTLNKILTKTPDYWDGAENCPDEDLLIQLWRWSLDCEDEFASKLKTALKGKGLGTT